MMKKIFLFFLLLSFCLSAPIAHAHYLWLNIGDDRPKVGQTVRIEIGWGHKFPKDEVIKKEFLNHVYAMDSKGTNQDLKKRKMVGECDARDSLPEKRRM
jgi:uncharacterized GH25 family protein